MKGALTGVKSDSTGKVREIYDLGDHLALYATDRISAFDVVLPDLIPNKGKVLTSMSRFWLNDLLNDIVPNHLVSTEVKDLPADFYDQLTDEDRELLEGRLMIVKKAEMFSVECIVRGYITGSGLKDYMKTGMICGQKLPAGLVESQQLPEPIFTPSTKATEGHDVNISFIEMCEIVGTDNATILRDLSLEVYGVGAGHARQNGIIMPDTKLEFGLINGEITLADEVLTPDSSRFWPLDGYEPGRGQPSFDKQPVRDRLAEMGWDKKPPAPNLPSDIIDSTNDSYMQIHEIITGKKLAA